MHKTIRGLLELAMPRVGFCCSLRQKNNLLPPQCSYLPYCSNALRAIAHSIVSKLSTWKNQKSGQHALRDTRPVN